MGIFCIHWYRPTCKYPSLKFKYECVNHVTSTGEITQAKPGFPGSCKLIPLIASNPSKPLWILNRHFDSYIERCSSAHAPWNVFFWDWNQVSDDISYRNISRTLVSALSFSRPSPLLQVKAIHLYPWKAKLYARWLNNDRTVEGTKETRPLVWHLD